MVSMGMRGSLGGSTGFLELSDEMGGSFEGIEVGEPKRRRPSMVWGVVGNAERRRGVPSIASWRGKRKRLSSWDAQEAVYVLERPWRKQVKSFCVFVVLRCG